MPFFRHGGELHYYAHVPKCGGEATQAALKHRFGRLGFLDAEHLLQRPERRWTRTSPQHVAWDDLLRVVPETWIASVFAIVRHPVARLFSAYNYASRIGNVQRGMGIEEWFRRYASRHDGRRRFAYDNHVRPQSDLVPPHARVFRLEDGLEQVEAYLNATYGAEPEPFRITRRNQAPATVDESRFRPYRSFSGKFLHRVAEFYSGDCARFGYDGPIPGPLVAITPGHPSRNPLSRSRLALFRYRILDTVT